MADLRGAAARKLYGSAEAAARHSSSIKPIACQGNLAIQGGLVTQVSPSLPCALLPR